MKLLHERLREFKGKGHVTSIGKFATESLVIELGLDEAEALADEIDKYYKPVPRYEDGEPVQFGDEIEIHDRSGLLDKGIFQAFHANKGSVWMLSLVGCDHERLVRYDHETCVIKRPDHKVLDADGVEIKVGDTVFLNGAKCTVTKITKDKDGEPIIHLNMAKSGYPSIAAPIRLTHKEPDSLEKLRDDIAAYAVQSPTATGDIFEWRDRLTKIMERDCRE